MIYNKLVTNNTNQIYFLALVVVTITQTQLAIYGLNKHFYDDDVDDNYYLIRNPTKSL